MLFFQTRGERGTFKIMNTISNPPADFFGHIPAKLPRLRKVDGCAADRQTESERSTFMKSITMSAEIGQIRAPIIAARARCRKIQDEINSIRVEMAAFKGKSKATKESRLPLRSKIEKLHEDLAVEKESALLK